jgi:uncharacterized protein (DUF2249 family)
MAILVCVLDIRCIPLGDRHPTLCGVFDSLSAGETFEFVHDEDPIALFYLFDIKQHGTFTWAEKEDGPGVWRITISKLVHARKNGA